MGNQPSLPQSVRPTLDNNQAVLSGEALLANLHRDLTPLTDEEVSAIVRHLDRDDPRIVYCEGSYQPYMSKNLNLGVKKERTAQFQATLAGRPFPNAAAEHFDLRIQRLAFEFVKSDVRIEIMLKHPRNWIRISGIDRAFFHYQLYAAFWLLLQERGDRRGTIEADLMGLGKVSTYNPSHTFRHRSRRTDLDLDTENDGHSTVQARRQIW